MIVLLKNLKNLNLKEKITVQAGNDGKKSVEIMVPLKYVHHFWTTLEMLVINWEVNLILNWYKRIYCIF